MRTLPAKLIRYAAVWLAASILLNACGKTEPSIAMPEPDAIILAFGDSLTFGTGAEKNRSYPSILEELTERTVINAGIPGEVSQDGLSRLPRLLEQHDPAVLILCHGGNDILHQLDLENTFQNLEAMVQLAQEHGTAIILVGVPKLQLLFTEPVEIYDRLAEKYQLPYARDILPILEKDPAMKSDAIHLNAAGYRKLAETIFSKFSNNP